MAPSTKSSFAKKKYRMAIEEQQLFAGNFLTINTDQSHEDFFSRRTSRFVRVDSSSGYWLKSSFKPFDSPPRTTKKSVSFAKEPAHVISSGSSLMSSVSEERNLVFEQESVLDNDNNDDNNRMNRLPQSISGVLPNPKQAVPKTEHLSVQIAIGIRHGDTLDNYTYCFPIPTAVNRLGQPQQEEFPALYCSLWQRDVYCPCFNCARHRRTLRQVPLKGKRGNLPKFPAVTPPGNCSFPGPVRKDNVSLTNILLATEVYTPVSELNYNAQVFEFKERQQRLRIRQAKALNNIKVEQYQQRQQSRQSIIDAVNTASTKPKNALPSPNTTQSYQVWCDELFRDVSEDQDALAFTDTNMALIARDMTTNNNYDKFVDQETEHEWDNEKRSLLQLYNDRATLVQHTTSANEECLENVSQRSGQIESLPNTNTAKKEGEKKQEERILNPITLLRLFQAKLKLDRAHSRVLAKMHEEHNEQERELFKEYPRLKDRFYELVGVSSQASVTSASRWWSSWLTSI